MAKTAKRATAGRRREGSRLRLSADLTAAEMGQLLRVSEDVVAGHVERGAPIDAESRLNVVYYAAWLIKQIAWAESGEDSDGESA